MSIQNSQRGSPTGPREDRAGTMRGTASDALSKASEVAQEASDKATRAASDTVSTVTHQFKSLLDRQVSSGADMVGHLASSVNRAAEDLEQNAPQLGSLVRTLAGRVESYGDDLRDQSVDELMRTASNFTRRQPALVFGLAALAGFLAFRTLKNTPPAHQYTPSGNEGYRSGPGTFHGV